MSKSILITGASSGIGAATARQFLENGWTVGLFARRRDRLDAVANGAARALVLPGDVTLAEDVQSAVDNLAEHSGRLDAVFANAGVFTPAAPIDEIAIEDWHTSVSVNLTGMFLTVRAAFGRMRRQDPQGGRILINGSISAHVPRPGAAPYTATKHALTGLTKQTELDGRDYGITCSQIDIGNAHTEMLDALGRVEIAAGRQPPPTFPVEEAARAVWHMATLPPEANILTMTLMAPKMPYIGRG
ncbi:MAG: SDR family oxidoreductase [Pseudomonadota bacterium]